MPSHAVGYVAMLVSALGFGSNFVAVKGCETGDGIAFQFFFCLSVWVFGLMVGGYRGFPHFHPLAMLGGWLWATGNVASVPAIKLIGLGLSLLLWGATNMLMGWASGTYGLFGLEKRAVRNMALNYAGLAVALVALALYLFVKPEDTSHTDEDATSHATRRTSSTEGFLNKNLESELMENGDRQRQQQTEQEMVNVAQVKVAEPEGDGDVFLPHVKGPSRFTVGAGLALGCGLMFGSCFNPSQYIIDHAQVPGSLYYGASTEPLDYVFAHFCGIFITSLSYFTLYCIYKAVRREPPQIFPRSVLPAMASGSLWAIAMIAWFVANGNLQSFSITFPIITSTPGLVAALWGIFVFHEIKGAKNLTTMACAFSLTALACILIALSA